MHGLVISRIYFLEISGNVKVFCRTRPLFEDEGPSVVEFPDDFTIRIPTGDDNAANLKKDFEFDRVYGPHVGQGGMKFSLHIMLSFFFTLELCISFSHV